MLPLESPPGDPHRGTRCAPHSTALPEPEPGAGQVMEEAGGLGGEVIQVGDSQLKKTAELIPALVCSLTSSLEQCLQQEVLHNYN